jgi:hypothetical protein
MTTKIKQGLRPGQKCLLCRHVIPQFVPKAVRFQTRSLDELLKEPPISREELVAHKLCTAIKYLLRKEADIAEDMIENAIEMLHGGPDLA